MEARMKQPWNGLIVEVKLRNRSKSVLDCLEELASALSMGNNDRSMDIMDKLVELAVNEDIAKTVLVFLLGSCALLKNEFLSVYGPGLLEILLNFAKRIKSSLVMFKLCLQDLWKAYVLELMAFASLLPDPLQKLIELRYLNGEMETVQTVAFSSKRLDEELIPKAIPYVKYGIALQVSLDVEDGVSLSGVSLSNALLLASFLQEMFVSHGIVDHFKRYLFLVESALENCEHRDLTLQLAFDVLDVTFTTLESGRLDFTLFERAFNLLTPISDELSWTDAIKLFETLAEELRSQPLLFLLASARGYIDHNWETAAAKENLGGFIEVRSYFHFLLTEVLRCPTDRNGLLLVREVLYLYMAIVFHELDGGNGDLSGLLAAEERKVTEDRLQTLLDDTRDHKFQDALEQVDHKVLVNALEYCIQISKEPSLILKHGRFL